MRTKPLTTGVLIVVLVTTISSQGMGQAVVRQVPAERPYFQQDRTSPSDLMVATGVTSNFADEVLHSDKGATKACTPCCISEPLWSVYAGAVFLRRDSLDVAGPLGLEPLDFDVGVRAGVDIDIRRRLGDRHELQVRYFGVDGWSDQFSESGTILLTDWETFAGFSTQLHSTEVNLRSRWTDWMTVLAGFRWVELSERVDYDLNTVTNIPGFPPFIPPISIPADFGQHARTQNHLYGFQLGTDVLLWDRGGPLTINTEMKAGIYSNLAKNSGDLESPIGDIVGDGRTYHAAFLGELGIHAKYQLTRNLALRAGYQLLWLEGVALMNDNQLDALVAGDVDTSGSPFYHGAMVGTELRW
jgi:hypothetical protein